MRRKALASIFTVLFTAAMAAWLDWWYLKRKKTPRTET